MSKGKKKEKMIATKVEQLRKQPENQYWFEYLLNKKINNLNNYLKSLDEPGDPNRNLR